MRRKHRCPTCERQFSRRWNRDRHLYSQHQSIGPNFSFVDVHQTNFKFNHRTSRFYDSSRANSSSSRFQNKDTLDESLQTLRKIAEFKRLTEYIWSTPIRRSVNSFAEHSIGSFGDFDNDLRSSFDGLEIVGYRGFLCRSCLVAHPLAIYRDKSNNNKAKYNQIKHHCNSDRLLEIQQSRVDKKKHLADMYKNHLPTLMLRTVKEWTRGHYTLVAIETNSSNNVCKTICVSSQKEWAIRVIHDKKATLTYDELIDLINTTNYRTYSYLKVKEDEGQEYSEKAFFVHLQNSSRDQSNFAI